MEPEEPNNCESCAELSAIITATLDALRAGDNERVDAAAARVAGELRRALLAAPVAPVTEGEALRELERATRAIFHFVPFGRHRDDLKVALARLDATRTGGGR